MLNEPLDTAGRADGRGTPNATGTHSGKDTPMNQDMDMSMLLTEQAEHAVAAAIDKARTMGSHQVTTRHLLWGLASNRDTLVARELRRMGVTPESIEQTMGCAPIAPARIDVRLSPTARETLRRAHVMPDSPPYVSSTSLLHALILEPDLRDLFPNMTVIASETDIGRDAGTVRPRRGDNPVTNPSHYVNAHPGMECIDLTADMSFCLGNACKYVWRHRSKGNPSEDLRKAAWYVRRARQRGERVRLSARQRNVIQNLIRQTGFQHPREAAFWSALRQGDLPAMEANLTYMAHDMNCGKDKTTKGQGR